MGWAMPHLRYSCVLFLAQTCLISETSWDQIIWNSGSLARSRQAEGLMPFKIQWESLKESQTAILGERGKCGHSCQQGNTVRLRGGGGGHRAEKARAERRRMRDETRMKRLGIDTQNDPKKWHKLKNAKKGREMQEEQRNRYFENRAWKEADLRIRAKDSEPWKRWGKKWQERLGGTSFDPKDHAVPWEDSEEIERVKASFKIHQLPSNFSDMLLKEEEEEIGGKWIECTDGTGELNLPDFVVVKDPWPSDLEPGTQEYYEWIEENVESCNRFIEPEDLIADQKSTVFQKSNEILLEGCKQLGTCLNVSLFDGQTPRKLNKTAIMDTLSMEGLETGLHDLQDKILKILRISPRHVDTLSIYGRMLHEFHNDLEGAEVMFKRGLEENPKHGLLLAAYAMLLLEKREVDKGRSMMQRALQADPSNAWIQRVSRDARWKQSVHVKKATHKGAPSSTVGVKADVGTSKQDQPKDTAQPSWDIPDSESGAMTRSDRDEADGAQDLPQARQDVRAAEHSLSEVSAEDDDKVYPLDEVPTGQGIEVLNTGIFMDGKRITASDLSKFTSGFGQGLD